MADAVVRQVDESYLPSLRTPAGNIEDADLRTVQRVGIVDGSPLPATHHGRRDVQDARQLQTAGHAPRDVADATQLQAIEQMCRRVGDTRQLESAATVFRNRRDDTHLDGFHRILSAENSHMKMLSIDSIAYDRHDGDYDYRYILIHFIYHIVPPPRAMITAANLRIMNENWDDLACFSSIFPHK